MDKMDVVEESKVADVKPTATDAGADTKLKVDLISGNFNSYDTDMTHILKIYQQFRREQNHWLHCQGC